MRWLRNITFAPSSPSRTPSTGTCNDSPTRRTGGATTDDHHYRVGHTWRFGASKHSRHRKFRNLSGREGPDASSAKWMDSAHEPAVLSRSPTGSDRAVPLPLPEISSIFQRRPGFLNSHSRNGDGDCPLPSPKIKPNIGFEERDGGDRDRDRTTPGHKIGGGSGSNVPIKSVFASRERHKKDDLSETILSSGVHQDLRASERPRNSFRIDVPSRSAPVSPYGSPFVSPQRHRSSNFSNYPYVSPTENQGWSAPELPFKTMMSGPPPESCERSALSTESSPMHSPRVIQDSRSPTGASSPLHAKLSHETHASRRECSGPISVHPLPLPPGASMPSPSASIVQANTKSEAFSMKDQWQKGKLIGRGTFGSVYVASNRENGALCAMKEVELFCDDPKSVECIKQLEQEIKVLSQLKHPNIVQYYGSDIVDDRLYIYLEYVHPGSINKYVREHCGAMTESVVRNFTRHILSGLAYLHGTRTIHRDIKGANLLVDSCGVVKLADFGMAKHLNGQVTDLSLKGSPYWMAPELMLSVMQKDNTSDLALAVDIWSLGCTIIEMFTGKPPWSEYEGAAAMFKVMKDSPPVPESLSFEAKDFLKCCFQRNPAERPSAAKLLEHPFMKNLQHIDVPSCSQAFAGVNFSDKCYSPQEHSSSKLDQVSILHSKGKAAADSVIGQPSHQETSDLIVPSRYSPRSTLEALPVSSPPCSTLNTHHLGSPSSHILGVVNQSNKKNHTLR